jgi:hypothetical protein
MSEKKSRLRFHVDYSNFFRGINLKMKINKIILPHGAQGFYNNFAKYRIEGDPAEYTLNLRAVFDTSFHITGGQVWAIYDVNLEVIYFKTFPQAQNFKIEVEIDPELFQVFQQSTGFDKTDNWNFESQTLNYLRQLFRLSYHSFQQIQIVSIPAGGNVNITLGPHTGFIQIFDDSISNFTSIPKIQIQIGSNRIPYNPMILYPIGPSRTFTLYNSDGVSHTVYILEINQGI